MADPQGSLNSDGSPKYHWFFDEMWKAGGGESFNKPRAAASQKPTLTAAPAAAQSDGVLSQGASSLDEADALTKTMGVRGSKSMFTSTAAGYGRTLGSANV